jgi:hypothetical protein
MKYSTFCEYRRWLYPGYSMTRKKEDVCDHCVRLQLIIDCPSSSCLQIDAAVKEKEQHLAAAITQ